MMDWQRRRAPDEVPTPVAVALSDFCRRARSTASPALVRDALSCLEEAQDALIRRLADTEPRATPLGPFAAVEVALGGLEQAAAAELERAGHYRAVRQGLRAPPRAPEAPAPRKEPDQPVPGPSRMPARARRTPQQTLQDRIAPRRRAPGAAAAAPPPAQVFGTAFLPRRALPPPRGRFSRVDPTRASLSTLLRPEAKGDLQALVEQVPHRFALLRALDQGYAGRQGAPLDLEDVGQVLERHRLQAKLAARERQAVLLALTESRGALRRASQALALKEGELERLVRAARLQAEVARIRERAVTDALAPRHLDRRLELLGQAGYLKDLGLEERFPEALERDLRRLLEGVQDRAPSQEAALRLVASEQSLSLDLLRAACQRLQLLGPLSP